MRLKNPYRWKKWGLTALMGLLCLFTFGQDINYKSQSLFIYQFTKYISWPTAAQEGEFVIGVFGNSPILQELELMAALKRAGSGQRIVVKQLRSLEELDGIHVLYLASSKSRELSGILEKLEGTATLVVAERGGLAKKGASINFIVLDNDNLRFEVNQLALEAHQLKMSDELLKYGYIVR